MEPTESKDSGKSFGDGSSPSFDVMFSIYDTGRSSIATEHLSVLLEKMGYDISRDQLERFLDELDPDATGEIHRIPFLKWFERWGDTLDDPEEVEAQLQEISDQAQQEAPTAASIQSEMLEAKLQRKQAEEDVQLLANRLAHLRSEEKKAQKKIDEANKRAEDIEAIKRRNAEHQKLKREHQERANSSIRHALVNNSKLTVDSQKKKEQAVITLAQQRAKAVQDLRAEAKRKSDEKLKIKEEERQRLHERSKEMKEKERQAARLREEARQKRERVLVKAARAKLADEYTKKSLAEKMLQDMEAEEARLIEKLRNTQEHQRQAYINLESAIQMQIE